MIKISTGVAVTLYLLLVCFGIFLVWLQNTLRQKRETEIPPHTKLTTCPYCHMSFLRDTMHKVGKCPQCSSYL